MDHKQRYRRLRLFVSQLNKERKKQAKKVDILCNDLIAAQREFVKSLDNVTFTAHFYESILGTADLNSLFSIAGKLIKERISDASVAFFMRQPEGFQLHMYENDQPITLEKQSLEHCFTAEVVNNVCKSNRVCMLDSLFAMGLQASPAMLKTLSAVTIPLGRLGTSVGFILIFRPSANNLAVEEVNQICAVTCGLSQAIRSCQAPIHQPK